MKPHAYRLMARCVEDGIKLGIARAYKHTDTPPPEQLEDAIYAAVTNELCEWFIFEDAAE
jgi:hypothetical protein